MKYTRGILQAAVDKSTSMAGVMRALGIEKPSGGMHAHLRRRIDKLGIDTSHFLGQAHNRGGTTKRRLNAVDLLVLLPPGTNRQPGSRLTRAMLETGALHVCERCGLGPEWQGEPMTLHVDHINGEFLDCRQGNLRFLCPNCHSQTGNFAGRGKRRRVAAQHEQKATVETSSRFHASSIVNDPKLFKANKTQPSNVARLIELVEDGTIKVVDAVRGIGCSMPTFYRLRERYSQTRTVYFGTVSRPRMSKGLLVVRDRLVVEHALREPGLGAAKIAGRVRPQCPSNWAVSEGSVTRILRRHNLSTRHDRLSAVTTTVWNGATAEWAKPTLRILGGALTAVCGGLSGSGIVPEGDAFSGP